MNEHLNEDRYNIREAEEMFEAQQIANKRQIAEERARIDRDRVNNSFRRQISKQRATEERVDPQSENDPYGYTPKYHKKRVQFRWTQWIVRWPEITVILLVMIYANLYVGAICILIALGAENEAACVTAAIRDWLYGKKDLRTIRQRMQHYKKYQAFFSWNRWLSFRICGLIEIASPPFVGYCVFVFTGELWIALVTATILERILTFTMMQRGMEFVIAVGSLVKIGILLTVPVASVVGVYWVFRESLGAMASELRIGVLGTIFLYMMGMSYVCLKNIKKVLFDGANTLSEVNRAWAEAWMNGRAERTPFVCFEGDKECPAGHVLIHRFWTPYPSGMWLRICATELDGASLTVSIIKNGAPIGPEDIIEDASLQTFVKNDVDLRYRLIEGTYEVRIMSEPSKPMRLQYLLKAWSHKDATNG